MKARQNQNRGVEPIRLFHQEALHKSNTILEMAMPDFNKDQSAAPLNGLNATSLPPARSRVEDIKYLKHYIQLISTGKSSQEF